MGSAYWETLRRFIESATEMSICVMTPDICLSELEELIGKHKNVIMLTKKMGGIPFVDLIKEIKEL